MSLRSCRWRGGSVKIRLPGCTGLSNIGSGIVMPLVDVNIAGSPDTNRTSSYLRRAQNLVTSFQQTGAFARSSLYAGNGSPVKKSGECRGKVVAMAASLETFAEPDISLKYVRYLMYLLGAAGGVNSRRSP